MSNPKLDNYVTSPEQQEIGAEHRVAEVEGYPGIAHDFEEVKRQLAEERARCEAALELLSIYNLGGMTDYNNGPIKRAIKAEQERDTALARLPQSMRHCTILFKECQYGHGWLTATNWIQHGCPTCERDFAIAAAAAVQEACAMAIRNLALPAVPIQRDSWHEGLRDAEAVVRALHIPALAALRHESAEPVARVTYSNWNGMNVEALPTYPAVLPVGTLLCIYPQAPQPAHSDNAQTTSPWVSVKDELPGADEQVLVWKRERDGSNPDIPYFDAPWLGPELGFARGWWVIQSSDTEAGLAARIQLYKQFDDVCRNDPTKLTAEALEWCRPPSRTAQPIAVEQEQFTEAYPPCTGASEPAPAAPTISSYDLYSMSVKEIKSTPAPVAPPDMVMVPREPTEAMMEAGDDAILDGLQKVYIGSPYGLHPDHACWNVYHAMLAAAQETKK